MKFTWNRYKEEWVKLKEGMGVHWERILARKKGDFWSSLTNYVVEATKISPYIMGHVAFVLIAVVALGLILWLF